MAEGAQRGHADGDDDDFPYLSKSPPHTAHDTVNEIWYSTRELWKSHRRIERDVKALSERMTAMERFRWLLTGGVIVLATQAAIVAALIQSVGGV